MIFGVGIELQVFDGIFWRWRGRRGRGLAFYAGFCAGAIDDSGRPLEPLASSRLGFDTLGGLQLGQSRRLGCSVAVDVRGALLGLELLSLLQLGVVTQVGWYPGVNAVLCSVVVFNEPRGTGPGFAHNRLLQESAQHGFGEDAAVA